ncbi:MAG: hypothetical protein R3F59_21765 [Myxococcota bacterium]
MSVRWRLDGREGDVLQLAQAGVERIEGEEVRVVPASVWVAWCAATAERAVAAWQAGPGRPAEHGWMRAMLDFVREVPPDEVDREAALVFAATINSVRHLQRGDRDLPLLDTLVHDTWSWACRRPLADRWCRHAPHTLAADAVRVHEALAARAGTDPAAAAAAEREAQRAALDALLR